MLTKFLLRLGNSPRSPMIWAIVGCIASFFCPMFLFSNEKKALCDLDFIQLWTMLLSCASAAVMYRVGFNLRHDSLMAKKPSMIGQMMGIGVSCCLHIAFGGTFLEEGTWPNVIGLELLAIAVFVLLEMARPVVDFYMLRFFVCLPIIAGYRRHGHDFMYFGWPMVVVASVFLLWRVFFLEHRGCRV